MTRYEFDELDIDCDKLPRRLRDWCRGHDESGKNFPVEKVIEYRRFFHSGGIREIRAQGRESKETRSEIRLQNSRAVWRLLHDYPVEQMNCWSSENAQRWFDDWEKLIPRFGCRCRQHWQEIKRKLPPDFTSAVAFYRWSVDAHNAVNQMLGKPTWKPNDEVFS